ncbi:MAG: hypothetical protein AAFQ15_05575 [Pseudomonadota bacterium]
MSEPKKVSDRFIQMGARNEMAAFGIVLGLCVYALTPGWTTADPVEIAASSSFSSSYIDRGETLALANNETEIQIGKSISDIDFTAGVAMRTPIGSDRSAFDKELGFTVGLGFEDSISRLDVSASYLSFPNSDEPPSVELAAELSLAQSFGPNLAVFYDLRSDVRGAEIAMTQTIDHRLTDFELLARAGFVDTPDQDYSYIGLEGGIRLYQSDSSAVTAFLSGAVADEDTLVTAVRNDRRPNGRSEGWALGLRWTTSGLF